MIEVEGVTKRFGATSAVADVGFDLAAGAFLTILGPSGCGKTTLLRLIAGFIAPDQGEIRVGGRSIAKLPVHKRKVGIVFQRLALFPHLSVEGNVAYPLRRRGYPKSEVPGRVAAVLGLVRLDGFGGRRIHELSGGQQQRVAIARALVYEPELLLLDEPLASLDVKLREEMQLEFRRVQRELGVTTINVTHDQREALVMSDRVLVMAAGRVQQAGPPREVYARPANPFVAAFLGSTNLIRGRAHGGGRGLLVAGHVLAGRPANAPLPDGAPSVGALRAEVIRVLPDGEDGHPLVLTDVIFEGERTNLLGSLVGAGIPDGGVTLRVLEPAGAPARRAGETVRVAWAPENLVLFPADVQR